MIALIWVIQLFLFTQAAKDEVLEFINKKHIGNLLGEGVSEYEVITPLRTDHLGNRIHRFQRSTDAEHPHEVFFNLKAFGKTYKIQLQKNQAVVDSDLEFSARNEDGTITYLNKDNTHHCAYHGSHATGTAALTTCNGLSGLIRTSTGDFFIHPMPEHLRSHAEPHEVPHVVFRRTVGGTQTCAVHKDDDQQTTSEIVDALVEMFRKQPNLNLVDENHQSIGGKPFGDNYNGPKNADSADRLTVETAAFVDKAMVDYIANLYPKNAEHEVLRYVLSIMNAIQLIYNEPSFIGVPVQFILIKVEIWKTSNVGFELTDNCDKLLDHFCVWQSTQNPGNDYDLKHWDHAFMFTGVDIKDDQGGSGVIGVAPIARMCTPRESCTLTETNWFVGVFTGAHEAGHNFGMPHDADGNTCDKHKYIMAPVDEIGQTRWSTCSKDYINKYLTIPWTICLLDKRGVVPEFDHTKGELPGQRYTVDEQCELRLGSGAVHDSSQPLGNICDQLKCKKGSESTSAQPALEGTYCGSNKVCTNGYCKESSVDLVDVDGGWGDWKKGKCLSGCVENGIGLIASTRKCDNPRPKNAGSECSGESISLKKCNDNSICEDKKSLDDAGHAVCRNPPASARKQHTVTGEYWQNTDDEQQACRVLCEIKGGSYIYWNVNFPDGTACSNGKGSKYCFNGKCSKVCDGNNCNEESRYAADTIEITTQLGDPNDFVTDNAVPDDYKFVDDEVIEITTILGDPNDFVTDGGHPEDYE